MEKRWIFAFVLVLTILISSCTGKKDVKKALEEIRTGTEGIVVSFLPNAPPDKINVEKRAENTFDVVLELKNKGAFPQPDEGIEISGTTTTFGWVYLSGFDPNIITFESKDQASGDFMKRPLEGKSVFNPNGGSDLANFEGKVNFDNLNVDKYEPTLLATACYYYETTAGPSVCIDPNPYSTVKEKKVCEVKDVALSNQGAPIAVTKIEEEAFATKTQFKVTIKNIGGGDVLKVEGSKDKCNPASKEKFVREDLDKVDVISVNIANRALTCGPFVEGPVKSDKGLVRLINGEGFIICEFSKNDYKDSKTAFTTPLTIKLRYIYRNTAEKKVQIKKEASSLVDTGETIPATKTETPKQEPQESPTLV